MAKRTPFRVKILSNVRKPQLLFPAQRFRYLGISVYCANNPRMTFADSNHEDHFSRLLPNLCNYNYDLLVLLLETPPTPNHLAYCNTVFSRYTLIYNALTLHNGVPQEKLLLLFPTSLPHPAFSRITQRFSPTKTQFLSLKQLLRNCDVPKTLGRALLNLRPPPSSTSPPPRHFYKERRRTRNRRQTPSDVIEHPLDAPLTIDIPSHSPPPNDDALLTVDTADHPSGPNNPALVEPSPSTNSDLTLDTDIVLE